MRLPADLLLRVPEEAVRHLALARLAELDAPLGALRADHHAEVVHDVRVALRRLRSALRSWRPLLRGSVRRRHRRALAALQARTGRARDAEVGGQRIRHLAQDLAPGERAGALWLAERLKAVAVAERAELCRRLPDAAERGVRRLRRRLASYSAAVTAEASGPAPRFAGALADALRRHGEGLLGGLDALTGDDSDAAHAARIQGKRLRYLVEPLEDLLPDVAALCDRLRALQDDLGELQDDAVLGREIAQVLGAVASEHADSPRGSDRPGLRALAQRLDEQRHLRLERVARRWRAGPEREALASAVAALAEAADLHARAGLEIERKLLLRGLPTLPPCEAFEVEQGWLPGERLQERLRRVRGAGQTRCWRTLKTGRGLTRVEVEEECPVVLFERLWPLTQGLRVRKRRYVVADGAHHWEIDEFLDRDLVLAEVELARADEQVTPPAWLAPFVVRDVTDEDAYVNRRLAR